MKKILGLDLGTNSIGTALLNVHDDETKNYRSVESILHAGSRIIPMDPEFKGQFEKGLTITKNADRRQKRSARRGIQRYKLRRNNLLSLFKLLNLIPEEFRPSEKNIQHLLVGREMTDLEVYELRHKGLTQPLTLAEFCRVLYHLNQRRGYQPTRKEKVQLSQSEEQAKSYTACLVVLDMQPTGEIIKKRNEYTIKLSNGTVGVTYNEVFKEYIGKETEVQIKIKKGKDGSDEITVSLPVQSEWMSKLKGTDSELHRSGLTPGSYFYLKILEHKKKDEDYRIRENLVYRDRYKHEFELIWENQMNHIAQLRDSKLAAEYANNILPALNPDRKLWQNKSLKDIVRDYVIYYQRPLKSQKDKIAECTFERFEVENKNVNKVWKGKKVAPVSHPLYQEFRIWQAVNNLKLIDDTGSYDLTNESKRLVTDKLYTVSELTKEKVAKLLKVSDDTLRMPDKIAGNETRVLLQKGFKKAAIENDLNAYTHQQLELLWHILYSIEDDGVVKALQSQFLFTTDQAEILADSVYFDKDWSSISIRAIKKMLPLMKLSDNSDNRLLHGDVKVRIESILKEEQDESIPDVVRNEIKQRNLFTINDFQGLPYWLAASIVYGSHKALSEGDPFSNPDEMNADQIIPLHSMRNPIVEQVIKETIHVVRDLWKQHGKPDEIRIELPREMKQNADQRARTYAENNTREKQRKDILDILKGEEFNLKSPSSKDIDRYILWKEAGCVCLYSNRNIQKGDLFTGATDIDHILPRQRYFDDSFQNKILVFREENEKKSNMTAREYMMTKGENAFASFENRVQNNNNFSKKKKQYLLAKEIPEGFINRQLNDSRYIARKVKEILERVCPGKVYVSSGTVTDYLKNQWGLNETFKEILLPRFERIQRLVTNPEINIIEYDNQDGRRVLKLKGFDKRIDHRHHALDAIVIAATKQSYIMQLNNLSQKFGTGLKEANPRNFPLPSIGFRSMVKDALQSTIVSVKSRKRLINKKVNRTLKRDEKGRLLKVEQKNKVTAIRGRLHEETLYGSVKRYEKIELEKAIQICINNPEELENLPIHWQKELIRKLLADNNNDYVRIKKLLKKNPITDKSGNPLKITVWKISYTKTYKLNGITSKQLDSITDRKLAKELKEHADKFEGDLKKAFNEDNLLLFNSNRKKKVFKVRVLKNGDLKQLRTQNDINEHKFVDEGSNYCFVIYYNSEGAREYDNVTFFDAAGAASEGMQFIEHRVGFNYFTLHAGEAVYVLRPGETEAQINWNDKLQISKRIFLFILSSGKQAYFLPISIADHLKAIDNDKKNEYGSQNSSEFIDSDEPRTKIIERCVKIWIDRLGNIKPAM